jgi:uncharacterized cupin superfamily protein
VANRNSDPARLVIVSEMNAPEVLRYPDSDKVATRAMPPGGPPGFMGVFNEKDATDYWEGEQPPS